MEVMSRYESRHCMSEMTETETQMSGGSVKMAPVLEIQFTNKVLTFFMGGGRNVWLDEKTASCHQIGKCEVVEQSGHCPLSDWVSDGFQMGGYMGEDWFGIGRNV